MMNHDFALFWPHGYPFGLGESTIQYWCWWNNSARIEIFIQNGKK
jgi:hypothetical protein